MKWEMWEMWAMWAIEATPRSETDMVAIVAQSKLGRVLSRNRLGQRFEAESSTYRERCGGRDSLGFPGLVGLSVCPAESLGCGYRDVPGRVKWR